MAIPNGTKLGPYEIAAPAGSGGMGEVYRARDTRLNRMVAIKILPDAFAADPSRLHRFEQETHAIAALNHPHIVAVHDVGIHDHSPYLVMEYLEGKTLRERLEEGHLPVSKAVEYAHQVARGLAAAHERGIVHRDIKPENIFLSKDGFAKLLDFGLAKAHATAAATDATIGSQTSPGVVMGTTGYMSPEQVRGEATDPRSDIFSFGTTLYEMLGGKRAFHGDTSVEVMSAILKSDPPEFDPSVKVSPGLERIVRHCLEKNPADRFQTARDLTFALGALSGSDVSTGARPTVKPKRRHRLFLTATLGFALAALGTAMALWFKSSPPEHRMEFTIPVEGEIASLAISPDGEMIAYVSPDENTGSGMLYLQQVGHNTAKRVEGSEGATFPFFSPNHEYVGFFAGGKLKKVSTSGGVPQILTKVTTARGGSWGAKDVIIYAPEAAGYLWRINADGTQNTPLTKSMVGEYEISHRFPVFLPDGDRFLFWAGNFDEAVGDQISGVYVSSLSADNKRLIILCRSSIGYTQGALLYGDAQNALLALPLDEKGHVTGQPRMVVPRIGHYPSTHWGAFSVSTNGILVYSLTAGTAQSQLTWYDRTGKELGRVGDVGIISNPNLSPDNSWVAFDVADLKTKNIDVWLENLATRGVTRFTFDASEETTGVWSRDGSTIAFRGSGQRRLNIKRTRGLEPERTIVKNVLSGDALPTAWTPAGNQVLAVDMPNSGGTDVVLYSMDGKKVPFIATPANETNGQISPDGKWVIYASNESGDWEIYGTSFPTPSGKVQISRGGGAEPRWRSDGKEIFYIGPNGVLMSVALNTEGTLLTGTPQPLFQVHGRAPASSTDIFTFDVAKDGKRFLVNRYIKPASLEPLNIVLNMNGN